MSYDLAVWEGEQPADDLAAAELYEQLMDSLERHPAEPPTPGITRYVAALLDRWPDITEDDGGDSPWADGPLLNNAFGAAIYFSIVWSKAEEASEYAARLAQQHGLVCYDPQTESLRPAGTTTSRPEPAPTAATKQRGWRGIIGRE